MKILHVETGRHLYGGAIQVLYLCTALRDLGVHSVLATPPGSALGEEARERGIRVRSIPIRGDVDVRFIPRLRRVIAEEQPDLVHCHSRRGADTFGGIAAVWAGIPAVLSRRVDNPERAWQALPKYRLFRKIVAISERIREELITTGVDSRKVVCVRSAVELEPWSGRADPQRFREVTGVELGSGWLVIGVVAQLIKRKGHRDLLAALPAILSGLPERCRIRVVFFGQGPLEASLRAEVSRREMDDLVRFAGFVGDLSLVVPGLSLVVHPAIREGLGVILMQAAAAGVPIVATRAGGIPEVVRDGINGLLVSHSDPEALSDAVLRVLGNPELAARLSAGGRELAATEFTVAACVRGNLEVYRSLLRDPERSMERSDG